MRSHPLRFVAAVTLSTSTLLVLPAAPASAAPVSSTSTATALAHSSTLATHYRSIARVRRAVVSRKQSATSVVKQYLAVVDKKEPTVNAMISLNPKAVAQAKALDKRIRAGKKVGSLAGVPFVVKDNMDVKGLPTTGGSIALTNNIAATTAPVVQRLLDQDAILIGKTNMSELAASYGRLGYSSAGGLTLNPANLRRNASGSSSGSAAAVAAGMAVFGLGTDTSGSVRGPATTTGMVGLRPTLDLFPTKGIIPLAQRFDTVGAITSSVADQAIVDAVLAGGSSAKVQNLHGRKGLRVGVIGDFMGGNAQVDRGVNRAVRHLRRDGVTSVEIDVPDSFSNLFSTVLGPVGDAEFAPELEQYLKASPTGAIKTLPELIGFYESAGAAAAPNPINPARLEGLKTAQGARNSLSSPEVQTILTKTIPELRAQVRAILKEHDLDALVFPTMSCVASPRYDVPDASYSCKSSDPYTGSYLASATGFPEVTAPVATDRAGLPIGISFLGDAGDEAELLGFAALVTNRQ